ncbi:hypothetical protein SERLADRAFT_434025 [Serpula lacrymans var. lacrymans S7.9]|uniref:Uncharacterized protein n=1 Tax=Serpula lacrymans var. lacrymans (strain S7.9) TaxID=578457 RepID=F8NLC3_SERL9|nr:uncharacterized protein SERLADRAFT_434025 [Serpula lacrymans var. lacrymans S7.9]EGO28171.1 hypothetical protein SERLADRAFT_434025 [Serpula lacrymans var. lacrymans S7.9]
MIDPTECESLSNCNSGEAFFEDDNNPFAPSAVNNTHNSLSSTDTEPSSDPENLNIRPVQLQYTSQLKTQLTGTPASKVRLVLEYMNMLGLNLPLFLDYLSLGDYNCITDPEIRYERTALMVSDELPVILARWHKPPQTKGTHNARATVGKDVLEAFAFSCVREAIERELNSIQELAKCPPKDVSEEGLTSLLIDDLVLKLQSPGFGGTPKLWELLQRLTRTPTQEKQNSGQNTDFLMFSRSHHHNRWPKLLTTFLCSQGITMSHRWSVRAFKSISSNQMDKVRHLVRSHPFVISHDNLNIPFRVYSQCIDNQSHFDSGTAATVYFQPDAPPIAPLYPSKGKDLERLHDAYTSSQVHIEVEGRTAKTKADIIPDVVTNGALNIVTLKTMLNWWDNCDYKRSMEETW